MAYSTTEDLILGNIPTPADAQKYVDLAANEIDGMLGMRYVTPITSGVPAVGLLLGRVSTYLSTGRLVMALAAAGEDDQIHQYGLRLIQEATAILDGILSGSIILPGVAALNPDSIPSSAPRIVNVDNASAVEAFAGVFGNPAETVINTLRPVTPTPWWRVHGG